MKWLLALALVACQTAGSSTDDELATARSSGDDTQTHDLQVRIDRLVALHKKRSSELELIRAGGAIPP